MGINEEDFRLYYVEPCKDLACREAWQINSLFPQDTGCTEEGREKALVSLVRFVKSGLAEFFPNEKSKEIFEELKAAPLNLPPYPNEWGFTWTGKLIEGSEKLFSISSELEIPKDGEPASNAFKAKLSKIFSDAGVGFDQDISY